MTRVVRRDCFVLVAITIAKKNAARQTALSPIGNTQ
jgi:hypothetical protein